MPLDEQIGLTDSSDFVEDVQLRDALRRLPEKYRLVLILHHLEGFSLDEMSDMLDVPATRLKSRLHQARSRLRVQLTTGDDTHENA